MKQYRCTRCKVVFPRLQDFQSHLEACEEHESFQRSARSESAFSEGDSGIHLRANLGKSPFQCYTCKMEFSLEKDLYLHTCSGPTQDDQFQCNVCDEVYDEPNLYYQRETHQQFKQFQCQICSVQFIYHSELVKHTEFHESFPYHECAEELPGAPELRIPPPGPFFMQSEPQNSSCKSNNPRMDDPIYNVVLPNQEDIESHLQSCGSDELCLSSGHLKKSIEEANSGSHLVATLREGPLQFKSGSEEYSMERDLPQNNCPVQACEEPFVRSPLPEQCSDAPPIRSNFQIPTTSKVHPCKICMNELEMKFPCPNCQKIFTSKCNLKNHLVTVHEDGKPFHCSVCGRKLQVESSLDRHMLIHTGEKPLPCDVCSMACRTKCDLRDHLRTNSGEKAFQCEFCPKKFRHRSALNQHLQIHDDKRILFPCDICKKEYLSKRSLKRHKCESMLRSNQRMTRE